MAMLVITHDLAEAVKLADEVAVMAGAPGHIVWQMAIARARVDRDEAWIATTGARMLAQPRVREAFGLPVVSATARAGDLPEDTACGQFESSVVVALASAKARRHSC
jgi:NitT/TauT family transport system ATP-binding protein